MYIILLPPIWKQYSIGHTRFSTLNSIYTHIICIKLLNVRICCRRFFIPLRLSHIFVGYGFFLICSMIHKYTRTHIHIRRPLRPNSQFNDKFCVLYIYFFSLLFVVSFFVYANLTHIALLCESKREPIFMELCMKSSNRHLNVFALLFKNCFAV